MPIERFLCVLNTMITGNNYSLSILLSVYVLRLTVSCINVTRTRITVSDEHQAVSENSVGCKWAMQFTWNINTLALALSLPLSHTQRHIQGRNPYRLEDICNGNVLNREKPERSWKETNLFKRETNAAEKKDEYGLNLSNEEKIGIIGLVNMWMSTNLFKRRIWRRNVINCKENHVIIKKKS